MNKNGKTKVFTWHVHGSYLYYLSQVNCEFYIPVKVNDFRSGYTRLGDNFPWEENITEVLDSEVKDINFDVIIFQSKQNYLEDQYLTLSPKQRELPKIYIEHDPPREFPTDTYHIVNDKEVLLVHVTHFNKLMWNSQDTPSIVIEHGVMLPGIKEYSGVLEKGIVIINNLEERGRRLGLDLYLKAKERIPLDLFGMGSETIGGMGEIPYNLLRDKISKYRFYFHPVRYTSLGLTLLEAMSIGMPPVALATTEIPQLIIDGYTGFSSLNLEYLIDKMKYLLMDKGMAEKLGKAAQNKVENDYSIRDFKEKWFRTINLVKTGVFNERPEFLKKVNSFDNNTI